MGAIVSDWVYVREESFIGAGAVIRQSADIPPRKMAVGVPARVVDDINEEASEFQ